MATMETVVVTVAATVAIVAATVAIVAAMVAVAADRAPRIVVGTSGGHAPIVPLITRPCVSNKARTDVCALCVCASVVGFHQPVTTTATVIAIVAVTVTVTAAVIATVIVSAIVRPRATTVIAVIGTARPLPSRVGMRPP